MIQVIFAEVDTWYSRDIHIFMEKMERCFPMFRSLQLRHLQGPQKLIKPAALPADLDGAGQGSIVQDVFLTVETR